MDTSPIPSLPIASEAGRSLLLAAHHSTQRMMEQRAPLSEILSVLASAGEAFSEGRTVCSVLLLDQEGLLRNGASPNLPADYLHAIDRLKPDPAVGTCAAAAATGEPVMTPNFYNDDRWSELRHWPLVLGFFGAWSMPIKAADGRVLGTFGTYFREHRLPTDDERTAVGFLAGIASSAIVAASTAQT
ncbi:GAF domain-containing protein [Caenimonas terrae]|uniref:GAF domain-containing protein n=1 Tax=Caenimonas terrae TaxID=696074 RepID=A0ABW0N863_9BURK